MKAVIIGVKVWKTRYYNYTREESLTFGGQIEAKFNNPPTDKEFDETMVELYKKIGTQIKAEVKLEASTNKLFKLAKKVERPQLIKGFKRILKLREADESD